MISGRGDLHDSHPRGPIEPLPLPLKVQLFMLIKYCPVFLLLTASPSPLRRRKSELVFIPLKSVLELREAFIVRRKWKNIGLLPIKGGGGTSRPMYFRVSWLKNDLICPETCKSKYFFPIMSISPLIGGI